MKLTKTHSLASTRHDAILKHCVSDVMYLNKIRRPWVSAEDYCASPWFRFMWFPPSSLESESQQLVLTSGSNHNRLSLRSVRNCQGRPSILVPYLGGCLYYYTKEFQRLFIFAANKMNEPTCVYEHFMTSLHVRRPGMVGSARYCRTLPRLPLPADHASGYKI